MIRAEAISNIVVDSTNTGSETSRKARGIPLYTAMSIQMLTQHTPVDVDMRAVSPWNTIFFLIEFVLSPPYPSTLFTGGGGDRGQTIEPQQ